MDDGDWFVLVMTASPLLLVTVLAIDVLFALTGHPAPIWPGNPLPGWLG